MAPALLPLVGFTSAGVAAGNFPFPSTQGSSAEESTGSLAATIQSIVYGGATGGIFSLLQSAGATMVLPSIGTMLTGAAATGAGVAVATSDDHPDLYNSSDLLHEFAESLAHNDEPDDNGVNPSRHRAVPEEYLLTPRAILAIVKAWDVGMYDPPETNLTSWLSRVYKTCVRYEIPTAQRARCAVHHLRVDYKEASRTSGCDDMTWDEFTVWLRQYSRKLHVLISVCVPC